MDVLCIPYLQSLPIDGVAISTLIEPFASHTVSASDDVAARLDEIQLDLGEGPCWDAARSKAPVLIDDLAETGPARWPMFTRAVDPDAVRAVFAFPLRVGLVDLGAIDLYSERPRSLDRAEILRTSALASVTAIDVLRRELGDGENGDEGGHERAPRAERTGGGRPHDESAERPVDVRFSRRVVHQATGMVLAQMGVSAEDALLVLRGHAFATDRTVAEVAAMVVARAISFAVPNHEI